MIDYPDGTGEPKTADSIEKITTVIPAYSNWTAYKFVCDAIQLIKYGLTKMKKIAVATTKNINGIALDLISV